MSDDEDVSGFGDGGDEDFDMDDDLGFGEDFDEEEADGFGMAEEEEEFDEEGAGWGNVDEDDFEEEASAPAAAPAASGLDTYAKDHCRPDTVFEYSIQPIKQSLLKLNDKASKKSVDMFKVVCQFMGITAVVGKSNLSAIQGVRKITQFGINDEDLRDELYAQLLKQMTKNPGAASRARGTILLSMVLGVFAPTKNILPHVAQLIMDGPKGYVQYNNMLLRRTQTNGPRSEPPCSLELEAVKRKQVMRVKVIVNPIKKIFATARLDPASTMSEWVDEITKTLKLADKFGYSIFINRFGNLQSLRGAGGKGLHVMDVISKLDQKAEQQGIKDFLDITGQLSMRKEVFAADHNSLNDETATNVIFDQIREGISLGEFRCGADEYNTVAALVFYGVHGEISDVKTIIEFLNNFLPEFALKEVPAKGRANDVEKLHAKGEYSRRSYTQHEARDAFIKYALDKWAKVNSFSADGSLMLFPNGKTVPRSNVQISPGKPGPAKRRSSKKK